MILFLVRHGETASNRDGVGLGRADVPLTEKGLRQAQAVAARVSAEQPTMVYSSPLQRAMETGRRIATTSGATLCQDERLVELAAGDTEGLPFTAIRERYPAFLGRWMGPDGHTARLPGGESILDLSTRVRDFLAAVEKEPHDRVVVVSHNFVLRVLLCELLGIGPPGFRLITTDLASLSIAEVRQRRTSVLALNDTCHLRGLDS